MPFPRDNHCLWCGAYLMGGATKHTPNCEITKMLKEVNEEKPSGLIPGGTCRERVREQKAGEKNRDSRHKEL